MGPFSNTTIKKMQFLKWTFSIFNFSELTWKAKKKKRVMRSRQRLKVLDLLLLMGFILPLSLCVGELVTPALADFLDHCPKDCNCKWANGKREADCTRAGFTAVPTHLDHEIQILRMTHNYVRVLGNEVFMTAGLVNLQRIFMNHCHVQVSDFLLYHQFPNPFVFVVSSQRM